MLRVSDGLVRIAMSDDPDARAASEALIAALRPVDLAGIIVFASRREGLDAAVAAAGALGVAAPLLGCTTAGEITPWGTSRGMAAIGFPAADFDLQARRFDGLIGFDPFAAHRIVAEAISDGVLASHRLGDGVERASLLLIDGLACREELITHTMRHLLEDIAMVGGSAGDDMRFGETHLLHDGVVRTDCAMLVLLSSRHPLRLFRTHHHLAGEKLAVVTRVDTAARIVHELNGEPAAQEYARLVGVSVRRLNDRVFAANPMMVRVGGNYYARAPMRVSAGCGLVFQSAIERGLVLRLGAANGMLDALRESLDQWADVTADTVIVFDSVHNRIEAETLGHAAALADIYRRHRFVGFHGYGEQYRDLHLNRNLAGLAIGRRGP
jgi:hypothetical protein